MVQFNSSVEFIDELTKDRAHIERKIVRVCVIKQPTTMGTERVTVRATTQIAGHVVRLDFMIGDLWGTERVDIPIGKRASDAIEILTTACKKLELEVRDGYFS